MHNYYNYVQLSSWAVQTLKLHFVADLVDLNNHETKRVAGRVKHVHMMWLRETIMAIDSAFLVSQISTVHVINALVKFMHTCIRESDVQC